MSEGTDDLMKILLIGNPNVGKGAIFSRLTGIEVISANYPGSTVGYMEGRMTLPGKPVRQATVIDAPGLYSLDPSTPSDRVARSIFDKGADVVVNVVDATNLERNLYLTLQIIEHRAIRHLPTVVALNLWDMAVQKGITIDKEALQSELGIPVIATVGVSGEGIRDLAEAIGKAAISTIGVDLSASRDGKEAPSEIMGSEKVSSEISGSEINADATELTDASSVASDRKWARIGEITQKTQRVIHKHPTMLERLEDVTINPITGIPIALIVLYLSFSFVIDLGEQLILHVTDPLFLAYSHTVSAWISGFSDGLLRDILVGRHPEPLHSFGLLTTGIYIPLGIVLPFLIPFYLILGFLEDLGYLPRLSVLLDALMHRVGLHGSAILPCVLGLGCSVPAVLAVRMLESPKQRFLAATLMTMAIPCASQNAMIFGLIGPYGLHYIGMVYGTLLVVFVIAGLILSRVIKEESPEIFLEIPPYRMPDWRTLLRKTSIRLWDFLKEAVPYIGIGMIMMNLFEITGLMAVVGEALRPVVSGLLGLPSDAAAALIIGFLRKDVGIGMFAPLGLGPEQLVISSVVLALYFPCVATFMVMLKEIGLSGTAKSVALRLSAALIVGTVLRMLLIK